MSAQPAEIDDDHDAIEWELIELVEEHGVKRPAKLPPDRRPMLTP